MTKSESKFTFRYIVDETTKFIFYNYDNRLLISYNKYILKYKLGSFHFDFKNKKLMNIILNNNLNIINNITQGKVMNLKLKKI